MTKIVLAASNPPFIGKYGKHGNYEALGIRYLASTLLEEGYDVKVIEGTNKQLEEELLERCADVFGLSIYSFQWPFFSRLSERIKENYPESKIVVGGYHPSARIEEVAKHPSIDIVVYGEGEETIKQIISALTTNRSLEDIAGIAYIKSGEVKINNLRPRILDIDNIPWPIRDKEAIAESKSYGLTFPIPEEQVCASVIYSRGCPFNCDFCSSPQIWQRKVNWRNPKDAANEIKTLRDDFGVNFVYFADLFFNLNPEKVIGLCSEIKDTGVKWFPMVGATPNTEIYEIMASAGCTKIGIGVETLDKESRERIGKKGWDVFESNLESAWNSGLITKLYLMAGYPWDTKESLESTIENLKHLPVDDFKVSFYTPFPGTPAYEKYQNLLITDDLSKFNTVFDPVLKPVNLSIEELEAWREQIFIDFFTSPEYQRKMEKKIHRWPHLKSAYDSFFKSLKEREVLG